MPLLFYFSYGAHKEKKERGMLMGRNAARRRRLGGNMATADTTQRQSNLCLGRYRIDIQKLKLTLAMAPGEGYKYGEMRIGVAHVAKADRRVFH